MSCPFKYEGRAFMSLDNSIAMEDYYGCKLRSHGDWSTYKKADECVGEDKCPIVKK